MRCRCDGLSACLVHTKELKRTIYSDSWVEHGRNMAKTEWIRNMVGQHARSAVPIGTRNLVTPSPRLKAAAREMPPLTRLNALLGRCEM